MAYGFGDIKEAFKDLFREAVGKEPEKKWEKPDRETCAYCDNKIKADEGDRQKKQGGRYWHVKCFRKAKQEAKKRF